MTAIALTIAGSDSGGGAGIQADLKTFSALGVYGATAITALTAQNTLGVQGIFDVSPAFITQQMTSVYSDLKVNATKIGMLSQPHVIEAVAESLKRFNVKNIVFDPVMIAASGDRLLAPEAVETLIALLLPLADILTPNLHEAAALLNMPIAKNEREMHAQAEKLMQLGAKAVLLKGGHGEGEEAVDIFLSPYEEARLPAKRIKTNNSHGTGCTLSSAVAAFLAKGKSQKEAVKAAKAYVTGAIAASDKLKIGAGHGPTHHFHGWW